MNAPLSTAVILAGGLATRLGSLTRTVPKIMVPVLGRPFIAHQLDLLKAHGITELVLCLGHLSGQVVDWLGDGTAYGVRARYSFDGDVLLGTGGALRKAALLVNGPFFCLYGDSYLNMDYQAAARAHASQQVPATMTVFRNAGLGDVSNVWMEDGRLKLYSKEKILSQMEYIDYGLSIIEPQAFLASTASGRFDLASWFSQLSSEGALGWFEVFERFYEIGSPAGLRETANFLLHGSGGRSS